MLGSVVRSAVFTRLERRKRVRRYRSCWRIRRAGCVGVTRNATGRRRSFRCRLMVVLLRRTAPVRGPRWTRRKRRRSVKAWASSSAAALAASTSTSALRLTGQSPIGRRKSLMTTRGRSRSCRLRGLASTCGVSSLLAAVAWCVTGGTSRFIRPVGISPLELPWLDRPWICGR